MNKRRNLTIAQTAPALLFFILAFLYIYFKIDPRLVYHWWHGFNLDFSHTLQYLAQSLQNPGGFVKYTSSLSLLYLISRFQGSLILTGLAVLLYLSTRMLFRNTRNGLQYLVTFTPSVGFILILNQYNYPVSMALKWSIAALSASVFIHSKVEKISIRTLFFILGGCVTFYLGRSALVLYSFLCLFFSLRKKEWQAAVMVTLVGLIIPAIVGHFASQNTLDAYRYYFGLWHRGEEIVPSNIRTVSIILPLTAFLILVGIIFDRPFKPLKTGVPGDVFNRPIVRTSLFEAVLFSFLLIPGFFLFRPDVKLGLQFDYAAYYNEWDVITTTARRIPDSGFHPYTCADINRALYESGRLLDEMFTFPQNPSGLFVPLRHYTQKDTVLVPPLIGVRNAETCLRLGLVNLAEQMAHELLSAYSDYPSLYLLLAKVNIIKKETRAARVFLKHLLSLENDRYRRQQAEAMLTRLDQDSLFTDDPMIDRIRTMSPDSDYVRIERWPEEMLTDLLKSNPENRMAFEYLIAHYLQTGKLEKVMNHIKELNVFFPEQYPRHVEEALVVYRYGTDRELPPAAKKPSSNVVERYERFRKILDHSRRHGLSAVNAARAAAEEHLESYFFYFSLGNVRKAL
ncbi:MAG: hypothetical protein GF401_06550 [Chitinivibrionales bacterium]|nr:hypothetical protein [Chitinivibrionales bacterium]